METCSISLFKGGLNIGMNFTLVTYFFLSVL
uniref:Uncharacterized protein n=1 Tax=Arundo donax TaxID=35708 RepID=A0A0A8ZXC2_ARUDO